MSGDRFMPPPPPPPSPVRAAVLEVVGGGFIAVDGAAPFYLRTVGVPVDPAETEVVFLVGNFGPHAVRIVGAIADVAQALWPGVLRHPGAEVEP